MPKIQCQYRYREGDKKVKEGSYRAGDQCRGFCDSGKKYLGYCYYHFQALYKRGELKLEGALRAEMEAKMDRLKINRAQGIKNRGKDKINTGTKATKYLYYLGKLAGEGFDAVGAYESLKEVNPLPLEVDGCEKYLFALWLASPISSRKPENIAGFADLVGISVNKLRRWQYSDFICELYEKQRKRFMAQQGHVADLVLLSKLVAGEQGALNTYYTQYPITKDDGSKKGKSSAKELEAMFGVNSAALKASQEVLEEGTVGKLQTETGKKMEDKTMQKLVNDEIKLVKQ